jgi:hypothetical protein
LKLKLKLKFRTKSTLPKLCFSLLVFIWSYFRLLGSKFDRGNDRVQAGRRRRWVRLTRVKPLWWTCFKGFLCLKFNHIYNISFLIRCGLKILNNLLQ